MIDPASSLTPVRVTSITKPARMTVASKQWNQDLKYLHLDERALGCQLDNELDSECPDAYYQFQQEQGTKDQAHDSKQIRQLIERC